MVENWGIFFSDWGEFATGTRNTRWIHRASSVGVGAMTIFVTERGSGGRRTPSLPAEKRQKTLSDASISAVAPVEHSIEVEPVR